MPRLGDWHGRLFQSDYPAQIFDAMRNVVLSIMFLKVPASKDDNIGRKTLKNRPAKKY